MRKINQNGNQDDTGFLGKEFHENPFSVPEGYFSDLKKNTLLKKTIVDTADSSFLVPPDYHESLRKDILIGISEIKLRTVLNEDKLPVPEGYFDNLQTRILTKTAAIHSELPIKKMATHHWLSYAAAACIAFAMGMFFILQWDNIDSKRINRQNAAIESLPTQEIINYLSFYTEPGDIVYLSEQLPESSIGFTNDIPTEEIEAYLENSM